MAEFRKEHEKVLLDLNPEKEKATFTDGNIINILPNKDHLGRRILVLNQGQLWNPDEVTVDQIFRVLYISENLLNFFSSALIFIMISFFSSHRCTT